MRKHPKCEKARQQYPDYESPKGADYGAFLVPFKNAELRIISSGSDKDSGWEHVSVSLQYRCPAWPEMCFVKNLFWKPEETVLQFHPSQSAYVNVHDVCLHLWREVGRNAALPPTIYV